MACQHPKANFKFTLVLEPVLSAMLYLYVSVLCLSLQLLLIPARSQLLYDVLPSVLCFSDFPLFFSFFFFGGVGNPAYYSFNTHLTKFTSLPISNNLGQPCPSLFKCPWARHWTPDCCQSCAIDVCGCVKVFCSLLPLNVSEWATNVVKHIEESSRFEK